MKSMILVASLSIAVLTASWVQGTSLAPDLLILNASVLSMDPAQPKAEAVAIAGNRIVAVGSTADLRPLAGLETRLIDVAGHTVIPGFNDAHVHWLGGGFSIANVELRDASSPAELARRLGEHARKLPKGSWILGGNWDHESWPGTPLPTKDMIDAVIPDHPVFVSRLDGHMALANSLALGLAHVTKDTKDVDGGLIVRDAQGEPTGVLKDAAMVQVEKVIPPRSWDEKLVAARAATEHAARLGVTSVQDMSADDDVGVFQHHTGGSHSRLHSRLGLRGVSGKCAG